MPNKIILQREQHSSRRYHGTLCEFLKTSMALKSCHTLLQHSFSALKRAVWQFQVCIAVSSWLYSIPIDMLAININNGMARVSATFGSNIQSPRFFFLPFHFWRSGCNVQLNTVAHQIRRTSPGIIRTFSPCTTTISTPPNGSQWSLFCLTEEEERKTLRLRVCPFKCI